VLTPFDPIWELDRFEAVMSRPRAGIMPMGAYRRGDRFVVHVDLPLHGASDIDLDVAKNTLSVGAERRWGDDVVISERPRADSAGSCSSVRRSTATRSRPATTPAC
jgi:HSP20 family protein